MANGSERFHFQIGVNIIKFVFQGVFPLLQKLFQIKAANKIPCLRSVFKATMTTQAIFP